MLGKSRFNRRLHAIVDLFLIVFQVLGEIFKQLNANSVYVIDSFLVPINNLFRFRRHLPTAADARMVRAQAFTTWQQVTCAQQAA